VDDSGRKLPTVRAEIAAVVKTGVLVGHGHSAPAADTGCEITRSLLIRTLRYEEVGHEDGPAGSLFHGAKAIRKSLSPISEGSL